MPRDEGPPRVGRGSLAVGWASGRLNPGGLLSWRPRVSSQTRGGRENCICFCKVWRDVFTAPSVPTATRPSHMASWWSQRVTDGLAQTTDTCSLQSRCPGHSVAFGAACPPGTWGVHPASRSSWRPWPWLQRPGSASVVTCLLCVYLSSPISIRTLTGFRATLSQGGLSTIFNHTCKDPISK